MSIVKTITRKKNAFDMSELNSIMGSLTGDKAYINPFIVLDKKTVMLDSVKSIYSVLEKFNENIIFPIIDSNSLYKTYYSAIKDFVEDCKQFYDKPQCKLDEVVDIYLAMKEHPVIIKILAMLKVLNKYESYIKNKDELNARFIYETSSCSSITIFDFCDLDFKILLEIDVPKQNTDKVKKYILLMFNILFTKSMDIYKLLTSPDIDPSEFSKAIINLTNSFKSQIPGCDRAFKKINESVDKLTASIGTYYKTLIITKDPTILVKSFLNDIVEDSLAEGEKEDLICTFQLKKIINHFKNLATTTKMDTKKSDQLNMLFNKADEYFNMLQ